MSHSGYTVGFLELLFVKGERQRRIIGKLVIGKLVIIDSKEDSKED